MSPSRTRARDADRSSVCSALDAAFADGQLDGAEHRERTAAALRARTLGELRGLVEDLQVTPQVTRRVAEPARPRGRARLVGAVLSVLLLAAGFGIGRATAPDATEAGTVGSGEASGTTPRVVGLAGLHTPEGFTRFLADVQEQLGTTRVAQATVYPGYAVITTAVPGRPGRAQTYQYRGGLDGPSEGGTRDADQPLVDLAAFDPAVVLPLVAGAPESLKVGEATSTYLIFDDDGDGPQVAVYASNDYHESGYLEARPDGSIVSVHPYAAG
ncbi:DUF1707 SHOCT-like domain-containing protein [Pseudonocardia sp.]|uniref:DUF1707 SHOCT-like domain-containing protein n=1 Tax=Pseudonocardia sp. TaxID=60912 RepID=UPI003D14DA0C